MRGAQGSCICGTHGVGGAEEQDTPSSYLEGAFSKTGTRSRCLYVPTPESEQTLSGGGGRGPASSAHSWHNPAPIPPCWAQTAFRGPGVPSPGL